MRALLVDDAPLARAAATILRRAGVAADWVPDVAAADVALAVNRYDCAVFERLLPGGDTGQYVHGLRRHGWDTPVLFVSEAADVDHRVASFRYGGDDHLAKPYAPVELTARVRGLCRRAPAIRPAVLRAGDVELDCGRQRAYRAGAELRLTAKEFAVLYLLASRPGEVLSRSALLDGCWDSATEPMSNVVDVLVGQLRRKVGTPSVIHTVRGVGYRFDPVPAARQAGLAVVRG